MPSPSELAGLSYLLTHGVGGLTTANVAPPPLPPDASFPYVTLHMPSGMGLESLNGPSGIKQTLAQANVWHANYETAWTLRETIRDLILATSGNVGNSRVIEAANMSAGYGAGEMELYDTARKLHQLILRIMIWWT